MKRICSFDLTTLSGSMTSEGKVNCDLFSCEKCNVSSEDGKICRRNSSNTAPFRRAFILKKKINKKLDDYGLPWKTV